MRDILDKAVFPELITDTSKPYDSGRFDERIRIRNAIVEIAMKHNVVV